jgi:hypothetical protein
MDDGGDFAIVDGAGDEQPNKQEDISLEFIGDETIESEPAGLANSFCLCFAF